MSEGGGAERLDGARAEFQPDDSGCLGLLKKATNSDRSWLQKLLQSHSTTYIVHNNESLADIGKAVSEEKSQGSLKPQPPVQPQQPL